ncbi:ATPase [Gammaproteobacteria bacterium]
MKTYNLEEVFKISGVPNVTFVRPLEYTRLLVSIRTAGRGIVIEGPSGIGKSTAVAHALLELGISEKVTRLSARKPADKPQILALSMTHDKGTVIIDDFHRLERKHQNTIADFLKTLADEEREDIKLVIVGINKVGDSLISSSQDLASRIDIIPFEVNPDDKVAEVVTLGEKAMNIEFSISNEIAKSANGSFFLAQLLCHETCLKSGILNTLESKRHLDISFEAVNYRVLETLSKKFTDIAVRFATGKRLRKEGRAPYLHILKWLAEKSEWSLNLDRELLQHASQRLSVGQVVEKDYIHEVLQSRNDFDSVLHYDKTRHVLTAEDPQFIYFLRNISWNEFAEQVGYIDICFPSQYDIALSFSGTDRYVAERLFSLLSEHDLSVFYDKNEQHRILAENIEEYLGPIYKSEASLVVVLLSPEYPSRIWAKFESEQFKKRLKKGSIVPIWFKNNPPSFFDANGKIGGMSFDPDRNIEDQLNEIVAILVKKMAEQRHSKG